MTDEEIQKLIDNPNTDPAKKERAQKELDKRNAKKKPYEAAKENVEKASAATQAPLASKKDVSMASNDVKVKPVIEAEEKRNADKMQDASVLENKVKTIEAEQDVQKAQSDVNKAVENNDFNEPEYSAPSEDLKAELFNTDEGQVAQEAIDSNDATELGNIVDPETNKPVLNGHFNELGEWVPFVKAAIPDYAMSRGTALALTLTSVALSVISGGWIPPIDFMALRTDAQWEAEMKVNQDYADLLNGVTKARNENIADVENTELKYKQAQEMSDEGIDKMARAQAAKEGVSEQKVAEMNADLQKQLTKMGIDWNREGMNLTNEQQIKMAKLLNDQDIQNVVKKIKYMREEGLKDDDIAKYISSMQGTTSLARGLGYASDITGMVKDIGNTVAQFIPGATPIAQGGTNVSIGGNAATNTNTEMLRNARYKQAYRRWLQNNPGKTPQDYEMATGKPSGFVNYGQNDFPYDKGLR